MDLDITDVTKLVGAGAFLIEAIDTNIKFAAQQIELQTSLVQCALVLHRLYWDAAVTVRSSTPRRPSHRPMLHLAHTSHRM